MKRHREGSELEQLQAENERLKGKIKIFMLERNYLQKRLESGEIERQLSLERSKQKLAELENDKLQLSLECERLQKLNGKFKKHDSLERSIRTPPLAVPLEPTLMLTNYGVNHLAGREPPIKYSRVNSHDPSIHSYIPASNSNISGEKQPVEFLKVDYGGTTKEDREYIQDAGDNTGRNSTRRGVTRKNDLRRSREIKIEPQVVCRDNPTVSSSVVQHLNGNPLSRKISRTTKKIPSKKALVILALKTMGGEGTIDDVDKWIKRGRYQGYGKMDRRSLSNALCKLGIDKKLEVVKRSKSEGWNLYRIRKQTSEMEEPHKKGEGEKKNKAINILKERNEVSKVSSETIEARTTLNKKNEAIMIPNQKRDHSKIPTFPLSTEACEFTANYEFGGLLGFNRAENDIKSYTTS